MQGSVELPRGFGGHPQARFYVPSDEPAWEAFVARSWNGTLLHTRRYLSYHGNRFEDRSLVIEDSGTIVGLLPAAVDPADPKRVVSHPGVTYGGLVSAGQLRGEAAILAFQACSHALRSRGHDVLLYKAIPTILQRLPSEDDIYALWRLGATIERTDLWAWVPANRPHSMSYDRRRALRRATDNGVVVDGALERLPEFWAALTRNLTTRHGVLPAHSLPEISMLIERFPESIALHVALGPDRQLLAGAVTFRTPGALHVQYSSPTPVGRAIGALDAVYEYIASDASAAGLATSFGSSTESEGLVLNTALYYFKASFGAASLAHRFYRMALS